VGDRAHFRGASGGARECCDRSGFGEQDILLNVQFKDEPVDW
jgi:hypothetical protein